MSTAVTDFDAWSRALLITTGMPTPSDPHGLVGFRLAKTSKEVRLIAVCACEWTCHLDKPGTDRAFAIVDGLRQLHHAHARDATWEPDLLDLLGGAA